MVTAGVKRGSRAAALGRGRPGAAVERDRLGALLLLAKSVQNSAEFGRLQPWILILNVIGVIALTRAARAQAVAAGARLPRPRARLAPHGAHRRHLRRPRDRAAADRVPVLARVPQPRHRQLVPGRGETGPERCARSVARRARSAHARVLDAHRGARRARSPTPPPSTSRRGSTPSGAPRRRWRSCCSAQHERIIAASLENPLETLPSQPPPDLVRQVEQRRPYVSLEPQAGGRYLIRTGRALRRPRRRARRRATSSRSTRCRRSSPRSRRRCSSSYSQYGDLRRCANR